MLAPSALCWGAQALAEWSALAGAVGRRGLRDPFAAAAAAEEGIALLAEQITLLTDPFKLDDVDPEDEDAPPPLTLDGMAGTARERHPGLFADDAPGAGGGAERRQPSQQQLEDRLHALADVSGTSFFTSRPRLHRSAGQHALMRRRSRP
jgi:hypothetical protein